MQEVCRVWTFDIDPGVGSGRAKRPTRRRKDSGQMLVNNHVPAI